jgi:formate dehydrogenase major subunit
VTDLIRFTLDGREVEARPSESIWQVAKREGIEIPHLCWLPEPGYRADGNCRACMVEVEGERVLTFMPSVGLRTQEAASTRSPSTSTMQARQLPSAR